MPRLIVEHTYDPPLTEEAHRRAAQRLDPCLDAHGARWMCSYISHDRRRMICEFEAPDAESVRQSMRSADVTFDRVWTSEVFRRGEPDIK
jgi:hypothetical protein